MKNSFFKIFLTAFICAAVLSGCGKQQKNLSFHTDLQQKYLAADYNSFLSFAKGAEELSVPDPIKISFKGNGSGSYSFVLSKTEDFTDKVTYSCGSESIELYNLEIGQTYYYYAESGQYRTKTGTFTVDGTAPRNLYIPGITNVRDLGGWKTATGERVNQGLIFRSSKFNADQSTESLLCAEGIRALKDLGIKTEIDLRTVDDNENGGITESPIGENVKYCSVPLESGGNIILLNKDKFKDIFAIFGNKDNYPIVFHCSIGTDRTGCLAFLINGLLGVPGEDLYRDFLFSNFGNIGGMRTNSIIKTYIDTVDKAGGSTLSDKIRNYLVSVGVDSKDIDTLLEVMSPAKEGVRE
ncbi:MAG: tyrosine-protein phosphatase [Lachnospiraceae bacterium]|nr:tyrosine-protein phosphatase [Lachnospiraceae bacterium]